MPVVDTASVAWWIWPIALFAASFLVGIVAVVSGIGARLPRIAPAAAMR